MSNNLTKKEITESVYKQANLSRSDISDVLDMILEIISVALISGRNIELRNFGVFEQQLRKSRVGRNPNKPEDTVIIPERRVIKFRTGKRLSDSLESSKKLVL